MMKGKADHLVLGDYNALCFQCGRKFKASQLRKHWQGYLVCPQHWEPRHPQDYVKAPPGEEVVRNSQPPNDTFRLFCTPNGQTAKAGFATAGCAKAGYTHPLFDSTVSTL